MSQTPDALAAAPTRRRPVTNRQLVLGSLVVLAIAAGLAPQTRGPFGGDEFYILTNLTSPDWGDRWFAFDASFPGQSGGQWYSGVAPYERHYVRLAPSALMSLEAAVFGSSASDFKTVSLLLHLINCLLGLRLLAGWLGLEKAAAITALVGLHPVVSQPVSWVACQPILIAMLATLLALTALERHEAKSDRQSRPDRSPGRGVDQAQEPGTHEALAVELGQVAAAKVGTTASSSSAAARRASLRSAPAVAPETMTLSIPRLATSRSRSMQVSGGPAMAKRSTNSSERSPA